MTQSDKISGKNDVDKKNMNQKLIRRKRKYLSRIFKCFCNTIEAINTGCRIRKLRKKRPGTGTLKSFQVKFAISNILPCKKIEFNNRIALNPFQMIIFIDYRLTVQIKKIIFPIKIKFM